MITVGLYGIQDTTHGRFPTYTHDHGIALMKNGRVLTAIQLERFTGVKHDNRLPHYITELLSRFLPSDEPVRFVSVNAFLGDSFISADGNLRIEPHKKLKISNELVPAKVTWFPDGLIPRKAEGWVVSHELAHLASLLPFIGRFEEDALAVHIDGGASDSSSSFWEIRNGRPVLRSTSWERFKDIVNNFNVNPLMRAILGFRSEEHLAIPGRLMGYAALGEDDPEMAEWLKEHHYFLEYSDEEAKKVFLSRWGTVDLRAQKSMNAAATIQHDFERRIVEGILSETSNRSHLYYAGGAALNIPTNTLLQEHFDEVWIPPSTNDSGLALGAAAWLEYLDRGSLPIHDPFLNKFQTPEEEPNIDAIEEVASLLLEGKVIGVANGPAEIGPRALGHRSLLALADRVELRQHVSENIKKREWYRPIAPILCEEAAKEVLEPLALKSPLSRWMLGAWKVQPEWQKALAGVIHSNGTVRAQIVFNDGQNHWIYSLLKMLWEKYNIPALINTSFNGRGQPIVQYHEDALKTARQLQLNGVVIHGSLHRF